MQKFTNDGAFISEWGTRGRDGVQFLGPHDMVVDDQDDLFIIDLGNDGVVQHYTYRPVSVESVSWSELKRLYHVPAAVDR
jgi:hypothetical protein